MVKFETNTKNLVEWMFGSPGYEKYDPFKTYTTEPGIKQKLFDSMILSAKKSKILVDGENTTLYTAVDSPYGILASDSLLTTGLKLELTNFNICAAHSKIYGSHWKFGDRLYRYIADAGMFGHAFLRVDTKKIVYTNTNPYLILNILKTWQKKRP